MTSSPLPRPVVMPEPFSGTEGQFKDWLSTFELCADLNSWETEMRRKSDFVDMPKSSTEILTT
jgi:hypothetical protein